MTPNQQTPTPMTDSFTRSIETFVGVVPPCPNTVEHKYVSVEDCKRVEQELYHWKLAALQCGLYRADADVSTPDKWRTLQSSAATNLLDKLQQLQKQNQELRDALEFVLSNLKQIKKNNQGGYFGDAVSRDECISRLEQVLSLTLPHKHQTTIMQNIESIQKFLLEESARSKQFAKEWREEFRAEFTKSEVAAFRDGMVFAFDRVGKLIAEQPSEKFALEKGAKGTRVEGMVRKVGEWRHQKD